MLTLVLVFVFVSSVVADFIPPPNVVPTDEISVEKSGRCVDFLSTSKCAAIKDKGYCSISSVFREKCASTCTGCAVCRDESKYCKYYYWNGQCHDENKRLKCKKTCRWCYQDIKDQPKLEPYEVKCGVPAVPLKYLYSSRIIGGDDVKYGSIPWQAALYHSTSKWLFCGASIINRQFLLTAAHCFDKDKPAGDYFVYLGKHHRNPLIFDKGNLKVKLAEIIIHSGYSNTTYDNDIALIRLSTPINYSTFIRPVCLPNKSTDLHGGRLVMTSGFGKTDFVTGATAQVLQQVDLKMINPALCKKWMNRITDNMFCAGHAEGAKDSCSGDSGGPLVVQEGSQHYLAGIVSWGHKCAHKEKPGVYVKVQNYLDWIAEKTSVSS